MSKQPSRVERLMATALTDNGPEGAAARAKLQQMKATGAAVLEGLAEFFAHEDEPSDAANVEPDEDNDEWWLQQPVGALAEHFSDEVREDGVVVVAFAGLEHQRAVLVLVADDVKLSKDFAKSLGKHAVDALKEA